jgi:aspartate/methionine/tyrosine aminotransferase
MKIQPFAVEQWMNAYETRCRYNLAETCVESLTLDQLLSLAGQRETILAELLPLKLTYGAIEGSDRLRDAVAAMYAGRTRHDVMIAHGAIGANALVYQALVEADDHVVAIVPNYQQHYSIPESLGARVTRLALREEDGFMPDLDALRWATRKGARIVSLSNPNNPTGALLGRSQLEAIARIAESVGAWVVCDEVYRGATQEGDDLPPSMADVTDRAIVTGSMSKAFSLAGLRLGWIVAPREVLTSAEVHRDYNTISVGMLDDHLAAIALEHRAAILARTRSVVRTNLAVVDRWIAAEPAVRFVRPSGGTTALLRYAHAMPSRDFCLRLLEETGVLFTPGSALEMEGYVRIGFGNNRAAIEAGLPLTSAFLRSIGAG